MDDCVNKKTKKSDNENGLSEQIIHLFWLICRVGYDHIFSSLSSLGDGGGGWIFQYGD